MLNTAPALQRNCTEISGLLSTIQAARTVLFQTAGGGGGDPKSGSVSGLTEHPPSPALAPGESEPRSWLEGRSGEGSLST